MGPSTTCDDLTTTAPFDADEPAKAHIVPIPGDATTGLCGAKLIGVTASEDAPVCETCTALKAKLIREHAEQR